MTRFTAADWCVGRSAPLGASVQHAPQLGVNFAVFSEHAHSLELCVFDANGVMEQRLPMFGPDDGIFHGFLHGASVGLIYGYRAYGPEGTLAGHRFDSSKLLLDPYAREVITAPRKDFAWDARHFDQVARAAGAPRSIGLEDTHAGTDSAEAALKGQVARAGTHCAASPRRVDAEVVLYEVHVKGFSMQRHDLGAIKPGTFAALAAPTSIAHLRALGVNTLCLLPVQFSLSEPALAASDRSNYWGYNTIGFFAADPRLASSADASAANAEFRAMVQALREADIDVVLDVVFNHTAEGAFDGPTLSFRGFDQASWYRLQPNDLSKLENFSGCGNTLNIAHPRVTQFVLDCLRFWFGEMGVSGFRFDLATALGRPAHSQAFDPQAAFFIALRQDPMLANARLIAEPWDCGPNGYQLGQFPSYFQSWNDRFRDGVRRYWLHMSVTRAEFAKRFCGSSDLFQGSKPSAGINYISAHDGFTLADMTSYSHKHNVANGEHNRDGREAEPAANFGAEGASSDPAILRQRRLVQRALLATLLLAQGVPMLLAGDELANSQQGNNNAYCQDNAIAWLDWSKPDRGHVALVGRLTALRQRFALLRWPSWFSDEMTERQCARALWLAPSGVAMRLQDWHDTEDLALACALYSPESTEAELLLLFNPHHVDRKFALPDGAWRVQLDSSADESVQAGHDALRCVKEYIDCPAQSVMLLLREADQLVKESIASQ